MTFFSNIYSIITFNRRYTTIHGQTELKGTRIQFTSRLYSGNLGVGNMVEAEGHPHVPNLKNTVCTKNVMKGKGQTS